ncbi:MAG TPA: site-specific tyrosine recombinase/integron integrase [Candidatus Nanoarchaeia archaeon]|nr:site-specific tyrosine recombinase/integron integrase [Candidatus Nanoarchaeia archaeon]
MEKAVEEMKLRGFSPRSIKSYCYHINDFMEYCNGKFSGSMKRAYLLHLLERGKEPSSVRLASSAIDFFTLFVRHETPQEVPLPKKKKHIPDVLTKQQIKSMMQTTENIRHRLIIEILYSSGIRLSELLNLKVEDISFESNTIRVRDGKGAKDRLTLIGKNTAAKIKSLFDSGLIFRGRKGRCSGKSVQLVISNAAKRAGIKQKVTPHMLRHSFATHLLESGVDIRYIQSLLGHERLATTQIYTRVAKNKLELIKSPLDD